jgi:hypothetical protein
MLYGFGTAWVNAAGLAVPTFLVSLLATLCACGGGGGGSSPAEYTVGGSIAGLTAPGLVLTNGSNSVSPAANDTTFIFPNSLTTGTAYDVIIKTQPSGLRCTVSNGSGAVGSAKVTSVKITCPSPWVWMAGANTANTAGIYGTMGVAAAANTPGARSGALSWTDAKGDLWMLGGQDNSGNLYNDLWEFVPSTGLWTWVSGANVPNRQSVYGAQGVAAGGNAPGARAGSATWIDSAGHLWLFGGYGYDSLDTAPGHLSDLWEFFPSTRLWTWMGGATTVDSMGNYGTKGVAAAGDNPPAHSGSVSWRDAAGDFWLFGGAGPVLSFTIKGTGLYNDLWKYRAQTGLWTWVGGPNFGVPNGTMQGFYGTRGVAAASNIPTPRSGSAGWVDSGGNLWLFGGQYSVTGTGTPFANDLWMYNISSGLWTWMGGSAVPPSSVPAGVYGTEGTPSMSNVPGARRGAVAWTDASGMFWLLGGDVEGSNPDVCCLSANDLWRYDPAMGAWAWISGSMNDQIMTPAGDPAGVYGTQGVAAVGNVPGGRTNGAAWVDLMGNLWLFGGYGYAHTSNSQFASFNDMWRFSP